MTTQSTGQWVLTRGAKRRKLGLEGAARLQTFPSDYPWRGKAEKQLEQVGNAVPPLLAAHVLAALTGKPLEVAA